MSSEIENFRAAVAKFDELQIELEAIHESLEKNFSHYKDVSMVSTHNIHEFKSLLKSINTLQINATNIVENSFEKANLFGANIQAKNDKLYTDINKELKRLYFTVYEQMEDLRDIINMRVNEAVKNVEIDTDGFEKIINEKLRAFDASKVNEAIKEVHNGLFYLNIISKRMAEKEEGINAAIDNINDANFNLSLFTLMGSLGLGLIFGVILSTVFKIDIFADYYFSKYDEKQEIIDSNIKTINKRIDHLNALNQWLLNNNIEINYGQFKDSTKHYIFLKDEDTKKDDYGKTAYYDSDTGRTFVFIKDLK